MGQKSNPNSFNKSNYKLQFQNSFLGSTEYRSLLRDSFFIKHYLVKVFERNKCFVQDCHVLLNPVTSRILVYVSFLSLASVDNSSNDKFQSISLRQNKILTSIKSSFEKYGYNLPVFFILKNLTPVCKQNFQAQKSFLVKKFGRFRKMPFFRAGLLVYLLLNYQKGRSRVLASFFSRFLRLLHRSKKINIFFRFIRELVLRSTNLRGLKLKIKGRFRKASRSKSRVFERGSLPLQTITADLSYASNHIYTSYGAFGLKV